ncbi:MAG: hypothetical protein AAF436_08925 [Myxococcota bacterium]
MPLGAILPVNYRILFDGDRYQAGNVIAQWNAPSPNEMIAASAVENEYTQETGVYEIVIDEPGHPVPGGDYVVGALRIGGGGGIGSLFEFTEELDNTPPFAEGIRLDLQEIFENDCGAKAILIRANLAADTQGGGALPLLVRLESASGEVHHIWSSISRNGVFFRNGWLHDGTYFQDCIGPTGIESLELEGEVTVTFTLFDFAGNAAEPITQVVQWPEELGPEKTSGGGCGIGDPPGSTLPALGLLLAIACFRRVRVR